MRKDESIERTFKGVAKNFREVFAELVPGGGCAFSGGQVGCAVLGLGRGLGVGVLGGQVGCAVLGFTGCVCGGGQEDFREHFAGLVLRLVLEGPGGLCGAGLHTLDHPEPEF